MAEFLIMPKKARVTDTNKQFQHDDTRGARSPVLPEVNLQKLADACKVDRTYLSRILHGRHTPGLELIRKLKGALGLGSIEETEQWLARVRKRVNKEVA